MINLYVKFKLHKLFNQTESLNNTPTSYHDISKGCGKQKLIPDFIYSRHKWIFSMNYKNSTSTEYVLCTILLTNIT